MPRLTKDQQIADLLSRNQIWETRLRQLAKDLLFEVDVIEPEEILISRFIYILRINKVFKD